MGLFSRLTASIRARSRGWGARYKSPQEYPGKIYEDLEAEIKQAVGGHEPLKAEMIEQTARLDECLSKQEGLAVKAVLEGQDEKAVEVLYSKLLASRQIDQIRSKIDGMRTERVSLEKMLSRLKLKIQAFCDERKFLEASLPPGEAKMRVGEAMSGLDEELAAVRYAVDRAKEKTSDAEKSCEHARRLAARCTESSSRLKIPDKDREPVARALKRLKTEVKRSDRPHPQR